MGFGASTAQEFDLPAFPSEAGSRHELGGSRSDAPAGHGSRRQMDQILLGQSPPASDHQGGHACRFSRQLQASRGDEAHARDLADHGSQSLLAQAFLDQRQDLSLALGFGIDDAIGMQAGAQETGRKQIAAAQAPEHWPLETGRNPRGEERGAAGELGGEARLDHLVQRTPGEAAAWQVIIYGAKTERQRLGLLGPAVEPSNLEP